MHQNTQFHIEKQKSSTPWEGGHPLPPSVASLPRRRFSGNLECSLWHLWVWRGTFIIQSDGDRMCCWTESSRSRLHENVLARTVLNAGNFLWMAKRATDVTSISTTLWTSRRSKGKVHWVFSNVYDSVNNNVRDILKQWHFTLTCNLQRGWGDVLLANHRKWVGIHWMTL